MSFSTLFLRGTLAALTFGGACAAAQAQRANDLLQSVGRSLIEQAATSRKADAPMTPPGEAVEKDGSSAKDMSLVGPEILGVRLGMSLQHAKQAITQTLPDARFETEVYSDAYDRNAPRFPRLHVTAVFRPGSPPGESVYLLFAPQGGLVKIYRYSTVEVLGANVRSAYEARIGSPQPRSGPSRQPIAWTLDGTGNPVPATNCTFRSGSAPATVPAGASDGCALQIGLSVDDRVSRGWSIEALDVAAIRALDESEAKRKAALINTKNREVQQRKPTL